MMLVKKRNNIEWEAMQMDHRSFCGLLSIKDGFIVATILTQSYFWYFFTKTGISLVQSETFVSFIAPIVNPAIRIPSSWSSHLQDVCLLLIFIGFTMQFFAFLLVISTEKSKYMLGFEPLSVLLNGLVIAYMILQGGSRTWEIISLFRQFSLDRSYEQEVLQLVVLWLAIVVWSLLTFGFLQMTYWYFCYLRIREAYLGRVGMVSRGRPLNIHRLQLTKMTSSRPPIHE